MTPLEEAEPVLVIAKALGKTPAQVRQDIYDRCDKYKGVTGPNIPEPSVLPDDQAPRERATS